MSLMRNLDRISTFRALVGALLLLAAVAGPPRAAAQESSQVTLTATAGFDGYYRDGHWFPVRVTLTNDGPPVEAELRIAVPRVGQRDALHVRPVSLPTQSRKEFFLYLNAEGYLTQVRLELFAGRSRLAGALARLAQVGLNDLLAGVVAGSPSAFNPLADVDPVAGSALVAQLDLADLPEQSHALRSLDVLVFSDVDTGRLSEAQRAALAGWVSSGGRLIVAGGPGWQKTAAGLEPLLPLHPTQAQTLSSFGEVAAYAGAEQIPTGPSPVAVGQLGPGASALVSQDGIPMLASRQAGYGQVDFLAFDPAVAPFLDWSGAADLYRNLLASQQERPSWAAGFADWYQAAEAVYTVPGLELPSVLQLCGFLGLYVLAIGPANYLVLRRLKRRELAWITIPALVLVFSGLAYLLGYRIRGTQPVVHRLAVVQVWPDSEVARVDGLVGLFSPRRDQYDLEVGGEYLVRALPSNFGAPAADLDAGAIEQGDGTLIRDLRVEVGGIAAYVAEGQIPAPQFQADLRLNLDGSKANLVGTITNASPLTLHDPVLLVPGGLQRLAEFGPGDTQEFDIPLLGLRAAPAMPSTPSSVLPASVPPIAPGPAKPIYRGGGYDTTVEDILGGTNYYEDRDAYRRYSLLRAAVNPYGGAGGRGSGIFLAGWVDGSPITAGLAGRDFITSDTTAYIVAVKPEVNLGAARLEIPPGLFRWSVADPGQHGSPSPYDMYVYQGYYVLEFAPIQPLDFRTVSALTLHLSSYGSVGPLGLAISLWDHAAGTWTALPVSQWGDFAVEDPGRFVGPGGTIQLRVENPSATNAVSIEASDFTLVMDR